MPADSPDDIAGAFTAMTTERAEALIVFPSPMLFSEYGRIVSMTTNSRLPAMGAARAIGTATTEAVRDPKIRALLAEGFQMIDDAFAARIRFARDHGDLPKGAHPATLAMLASATLHTLAIRSRAGASRSTLEAMADATVHLICGPPPGDDHDRNN